MPATPTLQPPHAGDPLHALIRFLRHERRCWHRVAYWFRQFGVDTPVNRCCAWHAVPPREAGAKALHHLQR